MKLLRVFKIKLQKLRDFIYSFKKYKNGLVK